MHKTLLLLPFLLVISQNLSLKDQASHKQSTIGKYCDEWDKCPNGYYCVNKKCSLTDCSSNDQCGSGFTCTGNHCIPNQ